MKPDPLRERLAYEAARILLDFGSGDYAAARRKAARRLGIRSQKHQPDNTEIQRALIAQQQLFQSDPGDGGLDGLRHVAIEAMRSFAEFRPRLVGALLDGSACGGSPIQLQLFAETPEEIVLALLEKRIPWRESHRWFAHSNGGKRAYPAFHFQAGDHEVELLVLPPLALRNPPLDPITQKPRRGASLADAQALFEREGQR